jgi:hypothetical protein
MRTRLLKFLFLPTVIALIGLVIGLNCLQANIPVRLFGLVVCNYALTSDDFRIRAGGFALFVLFFGLLLGPPIVGIGRPKERGQSKA